MPKLGDIPIIRERLDSIHRTRFEFLCAIARRAGVPADKAPDIVQEAYTAVLQLEPRDEIAALIDSWTPTPVNVARLDAALTALLVTYVRFRAKEYLRKSRKAPQPIGAVTSDSGESAAIARLTVERLDRVASQLRVDGTLTDDEWAFWVWRRANPDAPDRDFNRSWPAYRILRTKLSLFRKLLAAIGEVNER